MYQKLKCMWCGSWMYPRDDHHLCAQTFRVTPLTPPASKEQKMTEPTDAEIWQMWMPMTRMGVADPVEFARAILAKWGTPPAVAGEPVASVHSDTLAMLQSGQCRPWDGGAKLHPPGKARFDTAYTHLYTTPQPTQAQAGAEPLTDEQIKVINTRTLGYLHFARAIEHAHGIGIKKGDSHG